MSYSRSFDQQFMKARGLVLVRRKPNALSPTFGGTGKGGGGAGGARRTGGRQKRDDAGAKPAPPERARMPEAMAARLAQAKTYGQACADEGKVFTERTGGGRRMSAKEARNKSSKKGGKK